MEGYDIEGYLFAGFIYWAFCYGMSRYSQNLEHKLDTDRRINMTTDLHMASAELGDTIIKIDELNKWYGQFHVLKDINLDVKRGERIVICGPSGSGKSTLIRCINRLNTSRRFDSGRWY